MLFKQDAETRSFYFLDAGQIKLSRFAPDGNEKIIDIINPGRTFAEAVVFGEMRGYPVGARAITYSEVLSVDSLYYKDFISNCTGRPLLFWLI